MGARCLVVKAGSSRGITNIAVVGYNSVVNALKAA